MANVLTSLMVGTSDDSDPIAFLNYIITEAAADPDNQRPPQCLFFSLPVAVKRQCPTYLNT
jgi:hypothetical protein